MKTRRNLRDSERDKIVAALIVLDGDQSNFRPRERARAQATFAAYGLKTVEEAQYLLGFHNDPPPGWGERQDEE